MEWMMILSDGERLFFYTLEELARFVATQDLSVDRIEKVPEGYVFKETDRKVIECMNVNIGIYSIARSKNGIGWLSECMVRTVKYPDSKTCYRDTVDPIAMVNNQEDILGRLYEFVGKLWAKNHPNG